ncbi:PEP-CTERM sorting domain-containing protein [Phenylobacterium kunshanense]|uniref:PEP-CTERM protein-sorting domain-containing protein n=1 Tax=Phenylobacterium kunshanense TaxID=1445034 RepID=A0A328BJD4_9CAUL|nr:PEP-CTERM sorting domain-containing protein [Phenylobacterium kunshanense]RAK67582.1 hypothetical protein DJ019_06640 [Phenylobacterium kunshanense]
MALAAASAAQAGTIKNTGNQTIRISDLLLCSTADCRAGSTFKVVLVAGGSPEQSKDDFDLLPGQSFAYQWTEAVPLRGIKLSTKDAKNGETEQDISTIDPVIQISAIQPIGATTPAYLEATNFNLVIAGLGDREFEIVNGVSPFLPGAFFSTTPLSFDSAGVMSGATPYTGGIRAYGELEIAAAPEPATWLLALVGAGCVGSALRRRSAALAHAPIRASIA